jgi:hypothetical protein
MLLLASVLLERSGISERHVHVLVDWIFPGAATLHGIATKAGKKTIKPVK